MDTAPAHDLPGIVAASSSDAHPDRDTMLHSELTFYVIDTLASSCGVMATKALTGMGWGIYYRGTVGRGDIFIPGIGLIPLALDDDGNYTLHLTRDPRLPAGVLTVATSDPALSGLPRYLFLAICSS